MTKLCKNKLKAAEGRKKQQGERQAIPLFEKKNILFLIMRVIVSVFSLERIMILVSI